MEILIKGKTIPFQELSYSMSFNAISSTFSLVAEESDLDLTPFKCESAVIKEGSQTLFTGFVVLIEKSAKPTGLFMSVQGASTGVILQENTPSHNAETFQYKDNTIKEIAEDLCEAYDVPVYYSPVCEKRELQDTVITEITVSRVSAIISTLKKISRHVGLVVRHDERGGVLFTFPDINDKTVAVVNDDLADITISFNSQGCFNNACMVEEQSIGEDVYTQSRNVTVPYVVGYDSGEEEEGKILNTNLGIGIGKEKSFKSSFNDDYDAEVKEEELRTVRSECYSNIKVSFTLKKTHLIQMINGKGWINQDFGVLIAGDIIEVQSDKIKELNSGYRFMVLSTTTKQNVKGSEQSVTAIPHETFINTQIKQFWK